MNAVTPDWVKDAIFYQIFPDRFARDPDDDSAGAVGRGVQFQAWGSPPTSHSFQGGNLAGIVQRFDYLAELGVNAIYLNPIFSSAANHRYIAHDYYRSIRCWAATPASSAFWTRPTPAASAWCWMACSTIAAAASFSSTICWRSGPSSPTSTGSTSTSGR